MKPNLKHIITKYLSLFMGLYMLNISVDVPNYLVNSEPFDASYNLQESVIEIVVEQVLGFEDAIPETQDSESDSKSRIKPSFKIDVFITSIGFSFKYFSQIDIDNSFGHYQVPTIPEPYSEVTSPPPDFS